MKYERLSYTRHARRRMTERNIFEVDILRVMNDPDLTYPSYGKQVAEDVLGGGRLRCWDYQCYRPGGRLSP